MNNDRLIVTPDTDHEARTAIWRAICSGALQLRHYCAIFATPDGKPEGRIGDPQRVPTVETWRLIEGLSLVATLLKGRPKTTQILNIFGKTGPIRFEENGRDVYLWGQPTLRGDLSSLEGRPDLLVSTTSDLPTSQTALRVIESKCDSRLGSAHIRAEFGKAFDLKINTYFIWTFYKPSQRLVNGAKELGIDLVELGLDSPRRRDLVTQPDALLSHAVNSLDLSRTQGAFGVKLLQAGRQAETKFLTTRP